MSYKPPGSTYQRDRWVRTSPRTASTYLGLPIGARMRIQDAVVEVTGLRNPCYQLDNFRPSLTKATLEQDEEGNLIRKAGIIGIVLSSGQVSPGDLISVEVPPEPHQPLEPV